MTSWSPEIFKKAWEYATLAHQSQTYGGPKPGMRINYLSHITSVAAETMWALHNSPDSNKYNWDLAVQCAVLHDVIEDTSCAYEDIRNAFGKEVADGVLALTKSSVLPTKEEQMKDSLARIKQQPAEVWMVKLADRITNLYHPPYHWNNKKKLAYREEAKLIYEELKDANSLLASRLAEKIEEYKQYLKGE